MAGTQSGHVIEEGRRGLGMHNYFFNKGRKINARCEGATNDVSC
ncbi:protein of unknown function [Hyphomicrobium sp. 1Nfss2.1]